MDVHSAPFIWDVAFNVQNLARARAAQELRANKSNYTTRTRSSRLMSFFKNCAVMGHKLHLHAPLKKRKTEQRLQNLVQVYKLCYIDAFNPLSVRLHCLIIIGMSIKVTAIYSDISSIFVLQLHIRLYIITIPCI